MKNHLKSVLVLSLPTFLICFLLLELVVRLTLEHVDYYDNPMSYWSERDPYFDYTGKPGQYGDKTINSKGFISTPEIELEKDENTIRVVFLGGSSTAGTGVNLTDNETWPLKAVELLKKEYPNIDYINAAHGGYSTFESYGRLWSRLRFFNPDIIVVYHGWNDMYYFNEYADNPDTWKSGGQEETFKPIRGIKNTLISWSQVLARIKLFMERKKYSGNGETGKSMELKPTFNPKGLDVYEGNLNLIKSFSSENNIKLFVCMQATLITNETKDEDKERIKYGLHGFNHNAHVNAFTSIYEVIDQNFNKEYIIDLTSLSGISSNFYDQVHPTKKGTSEIARIVADSLTNNYFLKK